MASTDNHLGRDNPNGIQRDHHKATKHDIKNHFQAHQDGQLEELQHQGQKFLAQIPFDLDNINIKALGDLANTPIPAGLTLPKDLNIEQLQKIIDEFHINETRPDAHVLLPQ